MLTSRHKSHGEDPEDIPMDPIPHHTTVKVPRFVTHSRTIRLPRLSVFVFGLLTLIWFILSFTLWFGDINPVVYKNVETVEESMPEWARNDVTEKHSIPIIENTLIGPKVSVIIPMTRLMMNDTAYVANCVAFNAASAPQGVHEAMYDVGEVVVVTENDRIGAQDAMEHAISRVNIKMMESKKLWDGREPAPVHVVESSPTLAKMVTTGVKAAKGDYIIVINPLISYESASSLTWMRDLAVGLDQDTSCGFVQPLLSTETNDVLSTGIEWAVSALRTSHATIVEGYRRLSGASLTDSRVLMKQRVFPDPLCFGMRRDAWSGDANSDVLSLADAVLRWETDKLSNFASVYVPTLPVVFKSESHLQISIPIKPESVQKSMSADIIEFGRRWGGFLHDRIVHGYKLSHLSVIWDSFCGCTGFGLETVNFATALEHLVPMQVIGSHDKCFCHGLSGGDRNAMTRMSLKRFENPTFLISHKPPPNYPKWPYRGTIDILRRPRFVIGRSMTETTTLPSTWAKAIKTVDQVWVPTKFMQAVFEKGGVPKAKLSVVPIPFDVDLYNQRTVSNTMLPSLVKAGLNNHIDSFKFLSVFKWEDRKGWDVLLRAYFSEFTADDPVVLVLHTYAYRSYGNPRDPSIIRDLVAKYAATLLTPTPTVSPTNDKKADTDAETAYDKKASETDAPSDIDTGYDTDEGDELSGSDWDSEDYSRRLLRYRWKRDSDRQRDGDVLKQLPSIVVHTSELDVVDMPRLYKHANAFVLPTRGEGWCMPVMEAMAMELPVIVTNFSGPTEYLTSLNSFPLSIDGLVDVTDAEVGVGKWAEPSHKHLRELMRQVYRGGVSVEMRGRQARKDVVKKYSRDAVADIVVNELQKLVNRDDSDESDDE